MEKYVLTAIRSEENSKFSGKGDSIRILLFFHGFQAQGVDILVHLEGGNLKCTMFLKDILRST